MPKLDRFYAQLLAKQSYPGISPSPAQFKIERSHSEFTDRCWFYWASFDSDRIAVEAEPGQITQTYQWLYIDDLIAVEEEPSQIS